MSAYSKIHLSFPVGDLDQSVAFYKRFFGEGPVKTRPGYVKFLPSMAPLNLALYTGPKAAGDATNHFGIEVRDQASVMQHLRRIKVSGLDTREEMDVDCCHANQDKFWVKDPDGREWEIYVLNRDIDEPGVRGEEACCAVQETGDASGQARSSDMPACCG